MAVFFLFLTLRSHIMITDQDQITTSIFLGLYLAEKGMVPCDASEGIP